MATITAFTAERSLEIERTNIKNARLDGPDSNLILIQGDGTEIDVGSVKGDPGDTGPTGGISDAPTTPTDALWVRRAGAWTRFELPPEDDEKYVYITGEGWVRADQPWAWEFDNGDMPITGLTAGTLMGGSTWDMKFSGSGYNVNYNMTFRIPGTEDVDEIRFTLPTYLRPVVDHVSMAWLTTTTVGPSSGSALLKISEVEGYIQIPMQQMAALISSSESSMGESIHSYDSGTSITVRVGGSYTRASQAKPALASYI
jgi:hypothetical protein